MPHSEIQVELRLIIKLGPSKSVKKANLWLHLATWNLLDFLLCLESKTESSVAKEQNYMGGDTAQKKLYWKGGTPHLPS